MKALTVHESYVLNHGDWFRGIKALVKLFDVFWDAFAQHGHVDALGGKEYCRVFRLWVKQGFPQEVCYFIHQHTGTGTLPDLTGKLIDKWQEQQGVNSKRWQHPIEPSLN